MTVPPPVLGADALNQFLADAFPGLPRGYRVDTVTDDGVRLRMEVGEANVRPGGTVSGPTMMGLADAVGWMATLSRIGIVPLAVTTTLTINFVDKSALVELVADGELLRIGPRSSLTEVRIRSGAGGPLVAHATVGYAIPADRPSAGAHR